MVDRDGLGREHRRVPVGQPGHEQAEPDLLGVPGPGREGGHALEALTRAVAVHRLEVVEAPDAVEPEGLGEPHPVDVLRPGHALLGDVESEAHAAPCITVAVVSDTVGGVSLPPRRAMPDDGAMQIALALYPGFTALDIVGPFQTFVDVPGVEAVLRRRRGRARSPTTPAGSRSSRPHAFADVTAPDVIVVPGGMVEPTGADDPVVQWIRAVHPTTTWTTSVCTGSLFLAAAGVLDGVDATGHWAAMDRLAALGACPTGARVVERGKVMTAAGVSAGIDMGLTLLGRMFGDDMARAIQLAIEYDPQPPFDAGAPDKVEPELRELVRATLGG